MTRFVTSLNDVWPFLVVAIVGACTGWVGFKFGRRWRREWKEAVANRKEYHALKAAAQMSAANRMEVRVDASPHINVGSGVLAGVREPGYEVPDVRHPGAFCSFCGRFGCRATCREAVESGRAHDPIFDNVGELDPTPARDLVRRVAASAHRSVVAHRHSDGRFESDAVDIDAWDYDDDVED